MVRAQAGAAVPGTELAALLEEVEGVTPTIPMAVVRPVAPQTP